MKGCTGGYGVVFAGKASFRDERENAVLLSECLPNNTCRMKELIELSFWEPTLLRQKECPWIISWQDEICNLGAPGRHLRTPCWHPALFMRCTQPRVYWRRLRYLSLLSSILTSLACLPVTANILPFIYSLRYKTWPTPCLDCRYDSIKNLTKSFFYIFYNTPSSFFLIFFNYLPETQKRSIKIWTLMARSV